jgi:hypothetical protein
MHNRRKHERIKIRRRPRGRSRSYRLPWLAHVFGLTVEKNVLGEVLD